MFDTDMNTIKKTNTILIAIGAILTLSFAGVTPVSAVDASGSDSGGGSGDAGGNAPKDNPDNSTAKTKCIILPAEWCQPKSATNPQGGDEKGVDPKDSSTIISLLKLLLYVMAAGVGVTAVAAIVWAAILYSSASDNASQVEKAKDIIKQVVWGLVLFALMGVILNFLVPGGVL